MSDSYIAGNKIAECWAAGYKIKEIWAAGSKVWQSGHPFDAIPIIVGIKTDTSFVSQIFYKTDDGYVSVLEATLSSDTGAEVRAYRMDDGSTKLIVCTSTSIVVYDLDIDAGTITLIATITCDAYHTSVMCDRVGEYIPVVTKPYDDDTSQRIYLKVLKITGNTVTTVTDTYNGNCNCTAMNGMSLWKTKSSPYFYYGEYNTDSYSKTIKSCMTTTYFKSMQTLVKLKNGLIIGLYYNGYFAYSSDNGASFTMLTNFYQYSYSINSIAENKDGSMIVMCTNGKASATAGGIFSSTDGITWTLRKAMSLFGDMNLYVNFDGEKFIAYGWVSKPIYISDDGITWTETSISSEISTLKYTQFIG